MRIAFVASEWAVATPIDVPNMLTDNRGLTGSETSLFMFAKQVAKAGHTVWVFTNIKAPAVWEGVMCNPMSQMSAADPVSWDWAIAWLDPRPLQNLPKSVKKALNEQVNDFNYCPGWESYIDLLFSPSATHRTYLKQFTSFPLSKWEVLFNGVDPAFFEKASTDKPRARKMIFASSPDRGLHWLMEAYPRIRREVPNVELHVFYAWQRFYESVRHQESKFGYRLRYINEAFKRFAGHGVFHYGATSKTRLAEEMSTARVLAYPCDPMSFTEGFSVTTLESAVAGCVPVIIGADALPEVYGGHIPVIPAPYAAHKDDYINTVVKMLKDDEAWVAASTKGRASLRGIYSWETLGATLMGHL